MLNLDSQAHPGIAAGEASAMKLARSIGLTTVDIDLRSPLATSAV